MSNINFNPWVGTEYATKGYQGKRILVLGESHYCGDCAPGGFCYPECKVSDNCHNFTINIINGYLKEYRGSGDDRYQQTFLTFERALAGKVLTLDERLELWNSIIFYNYVQVALPGNRMSPTQQQFMQAENAFKELLETYMPDYIIVWGVRLYNELPDWDGEHSLLHVDELCTDVWTYNINGKGIPAMKILHPSSSRGKSWENWHKLYRVFLNIE